MNECSQVLLVKIAKISKRQCLVCRRREEKDRLFRFAFDGPTLRWDRDHRQVGRGVYVHPNLQCLTSAVDPVRWTRALKSATLSKEEVSGALKEALSVVIKKVE